MSDAAICITGQELWDAHDSKIASDLKLWASERDLTISQLAAAALSILALNIKEIECARCRQAFAAQHVRFLSEWLAPGNTGTSH